MKSLSSVIIIVLILSGGCTADPLDESVNERFMNSVNKILGYHIEGQEETWGNQDIALLNVYEDALVFKENDSINVAFIGFGYGHNDLSAYYITRENYASWSIHNTFITIRFENGTTENWEILESNDGFLSFKQESTGEKFSMKVMN